jgi:Mg2+ and Co2+ transporter CorA
MYNLTVNRDSIISLKIADESTNIGRKTRRDTTSMKTIATLTMFYLPATFVCSLFGTNFFALNTNGGGRPVFVVFELWWVYLLVVIPLTLLTFGIWIWWMRRASSISKLYQEGKPCIIEWQQGYSNTRGVCRGPSCG